MTALALGQLTGEIIQKTGDTYAFFEGKAKSKFIELTKADQEGTTKNILDWFTPDVQEYIAKIAFGLGVLYNFKENRWAFLTGTTLGFFSSLGAVPGFLSYQTLENNELLSMKAEEGFKAQKVMAFIAFLNWYLGDTLLDNMFFGMFSGLITGNCLYHAGKDKIDAKWAEFKDTKAGELTQKIYDESARRINEAAEVIFGKSDINDID